MDAMGLGVALAMLKDRAPATADELQQHIADLEARLKQAEADREALRREKAAWTLREGDWQQATRCSTPTLAAAYRAQVLEEAREAVRAELTTGLLTPGIVTQALKAIDALKDNPPAPEHCGRPMVARHGSGGAFMAWECVECHASGHLPRLPPSPPTPERG